MRIEISVMLKNIFIKVCFYMQIKKIKKDPNILYDTKLYES